MIFRRYFLFLTLLWIKWWRKKDRGKRFFLKPLGLCIYCYSTWIAIIFYLLFIGINPHIFLFLGLNYLYIEIFMKYLII